MSFKKRNWKENLNQNRPNLIWKNKINLWSNRLTKKKKLFFSPRPLRPTNLKSLNFATWFFMTVVQFLSSPQKFSSFPHIKWQGVPSCTSPNATTLNATGKVLFDRQWVGRVEQTMWGDPVRVSSPGCSAISESIVLSAKFSAVKGESRPEFAAAEPPFVELAEEFLWLLAPEFPLCSEGAVVEVTSDAMCIFIPLEKESSPNRKIQNFFFSYSKTSKLQNNLHKTFHKLSKQIEKLYSVRSRSLTECFCQLHRENLSLANPFRSVMFCGFGKRRIKIIITRPKKKLLDGERGKKSLSRIFLWRVWLRESQWVVLLLVLLLFFFRKSLKKPTQALAISFKSFYCSFEDNK